MAENMLLFNIMNAGNT